jgi:uncharacterized protein YlzI (FlbEa/FlbD family)
VLDKQLIVLCENDSRLGFHSEAEGYKYFPEKIKWRMEQLKSVLKNDVPEVKEKILKSQLLFPEYTGKNPEGALADCVSSDGSIWSDAAPVVPRNLKWQPLSYGPDKREIQWASTHDNKALYILVTDRQIIDSAFKLSPISGIQIRIEPRRLWPCKQYNFITKSEKYVGKMIRVIKLQGQSYTVVRILLECIGSEAKQLSPVRIDLTVGNNSWQRLHPCTSRLELGTDNSADLGWLVFRN